MGLLSRAPVHGHGVRGIDPSAWPVPPTWSLHYSPVTDSTNDDARRAADQGCPDRSVFLADEQRRGRGRLGRQWVSPAGSSLLFSLLFRRPLEPITLTAVSSVSVVEALDSVGLAARIKWPNDIMVGHRKLGGILTEVAQYPRGGRATIVGIGLNVNLDCASAGLPPSATSLSAECGRPVPRDHLLWEVLTRLDGNLQLDSDAVHERVHQRWNALLWRRYQRVRVDRFGSEVAGVVEGLSPTGALRVRLGDGRLLEVSDGDVFVG